MADPFLTEYSRIEDVPVVSQQEAESAPSTAIAPMGVLGGETPLSADTGDRSSILNSPTTFAATGSVFKPESGKAQSSTTPSLVEAQKSIAAVREKQSSFWPNFIAVAAALQGNFGPAFQLQEQKRKTAIANKMLPAVYQIGQLRDKGEYGQALSLAEQLSTAVGERAPELMNFVKGMSDDLNKRQYEFAKAKAYYEIIGKNVQKNHPDYPIYQALGAAVKNNTPIAFDILKEVANNKLHIQNINQQSVLTSPVSGATTTLPLPSVYTDKDVNNYAGLNVASAHEITPKELLNVMNGYPVEGVSPEKAAQIRKDMIYLQPYTADLEYIAPNVPTDPALTTAALANGVDRLSLATRRAQPGQLSEAIQTHINRQAQSAMAVNKAQIQAGVDISPTMASQANVVYIDPTPGLNYGMAKNMVSVADAQRAGYIPVDKQTYQDTFIPGLDIKKGLSYLPEMFQQYGSVDTVIDRLGAGVNRIISDRLGIAIKPGMTLGKAAEQAVRDSIQHMDITPGLKSISTGQLKELMTNGFASPEEAIQAGNMLIDRINQRLNRVVGSTNVPQDRLTAPTPSKAPGQRPGAVKKGDVEGAIQKYGTPGGRERYNTPETRQEDLQQQGIDPTPGTYRPVPGSLKPTRRK